MKLLITNQINDQVRIVWSKAYIMESVQISQAWPCGPRSAATWQEQANMRLDLDVTWWQPDGTAGVAGIWSVGR
jgi:hypothetical protein